MTEIDAVETLPASPLHDCGVLMGLHTRPGQCPLTGKTLREQQSEDRGVVTHADYDHSRGCQYCGAGPETLQPLTPTPEGE